MSATGSGLTNIAPTGNTGLGILDTYGPTGTIPTDYMGYSNMMPPQYGYANLYPMGSSGYPTANVFPTPLYQTAGGALAASTGPPTTPPELTSRSRERGGGGTGSSQESSATSQEHSAQVASPPPATSIQALTQQVWACRMSELAIAASH